MNAVLFRQFFLYCVGGAMAAVANLVVTYALTEWLLVWYLASYVIGTSIAIFVNFLYQRKVTFGVADQVMQRVRRFLVVMAIAFAMNVSMVYTLTDILGVWYLASVVMVTLVVVVFNYGANKIWTFS